MRFSPWAVGLFLSRFFTEAHNPARNYVVAEEVDKELPLAAHDTGGLGREFTRRSFEIRDFVKNKDESGARGATWARLAEMAGLRSADLVSPKLAWGRPHIIANAKPQYCAS